MERGEELDRRLIGVIDVAESAYPYVSLDRIRALARSNGAVGASSRGLATWIRRAVVEGLLLSDTRLRLRRSGQSEPIQIYRLNRRHPSVARALDGGQV